MLRNAYLFIRQSLYKTKANAYIFISRLMPESRYMDATACVELGRLS